MTADEDVYEAAKAKVVEALLELLQAADLIGRDGQLAMAETLGAFMVAAEKAQATV